MPINPEGLLRVSGLSAFLSTNEMAPIPIVINHFDRSPSSQTEHNSTASGKNESGDSRASSRSLTACHVFRETLPKGTKPLQVLTSGDKVRSIHGPTYTRLSEHRGDIRRFNERPTSRNAVGDPSPASVNV